MYRYFEGTLYSGTSLAATTATPSLDLKKWHMGSFQISITVGAAISWTVAVQGSNDGVTWVNTATPTAVTGATDLVLSISDLTSRYYRVNLVRTSGTISTISVKHVLKGLTT
jgi:hypothetical protein